MVSDWNEDILSNIAEIIDSRHKTPVYSDSGYPMVRVVDVNGGALNLESTKRVSDEVYEDFSRGRDPEVGDLVISRVGSYGVVSYVNSNEKFCLGQNTAFIIPKINSRFLYYQLISPFVKWQIEQFVVGAVQKTISLKSIRQFQIKLPPVTEQKAIAHILGSLDDKIELNRQMNETLEAMAQALFKSWFVDFDPVIDNALAAGNAIPDEFAGRAEQRKSIKKKDNSDIQKLFPNEFEFTEEMGWIPKGWSIKKAEEIASITIGKTPPRKESKWFSDTQKDNLVWVSIRDMGNSNVFINDSSEYLTKESIKKFNVKVIPRNSVMLSFKLTLGRVLIAQKELTTNEAIAHFCNPQFSMSKEYIYCYLSNFKYDSLGSTSSIATAVNSKIIKGMPFIVPSEQVLSAFETLSKIYFDKISLVNQQIDSLANLRDTLLPKLMSGELRIADAAAMVEEV